MTDVEMQAFFETMPDEFSMSQIIRAFYEKGIFDASTPPTCAQGQEEMFDYSPWMPPFYRECGSIFDSKHRKLLDIRGWGFLTGGGAGGLGMDPDKAAETQDRLADHLLALLNDRALPIKEGE